MRHGAPSSEQPIGIYLLVTKTPISTLNEGDMTEQKIQARDRFKEYVEHELCWGSIGALTDQQRSNALVRFYIDKIHNQTKTEISEEDIDSGLVDGAGDLGIDFIHRDDNKVLIVQAKHRKPKAEEPPSEISHFRSVFERILDPTLKANSKISEKLSDIDIDNDNFELYYIALSEIKNQAENITQSPISYPASHTDLSERCTWEFLSEPKLTEELRNAINVSNGPKDTVNTLHAASKKLGNAAKAIIEIEVGGHRSCIMAISAKQIIEAYKKSGKDSLFSFNIRNYIGSTSTNKKIIETARTDPSLFFFYNNGISCLCTELKVYEDSIEVKGLQVINGAQTVKALYRAQEKRPGQTDPWVNETPIILARITEIPQGYGQSGSLKDKITQYNNTQNTVKISDFRSNDMVQKNLIDQFSKIHRHGKKVFYSPKRTDTKPPNSELIKLEEFSKTIYSFLEDPVSFSGSTSFLFDDSKNGGYNKIFGWEVMPKEEFELRAAIYWLGCEFGDQIKIDKEEILDIDKRAALERKWMVIFASRVVLEKAFPGDDWKIQLRKAYKGDWKLGVDARGEWFKRIYNFAKSSVIQVYETSKKNDPKFTHRNWMRSKDTPVLIASFIGNIYEAVFSDPIKPIPN